MKLFNFFFSFILVYISYSRNINNTIQITHSGQDYNLAYIDPLSSGEMVYSNISFGTSADVQEVLAVLEDVNYLDNTNQLVSGGEMSVVRKLNGEIKVIKLNYNLSDEYFKNINDFTATYDKTNSVPEGIRILAFDLYKQGNWKDLESLFKNNNLNKKGTTIWPPANGGYNIVDNVDLKAGMKFDRYGGATPGWDGQGIPPLGGNFTSPMTQAGGAFNFGERALNQLENSYDFYYEIEILQDLPFKGQTADVIPWFDQVGGGKQTMWYIPKTGNYPKTWNMLATEGYVKITIKSSPSGNFPNLVNTVIQ
jgi:hypothetical protein